MPVAESRSATSSLDRPTCLVFRDKLLLPSEGFIPTHYVGFEQIQPVYVANQLGWRAAEIMAPQIATGAGLVARNLFKQFGVTSQAAAMAAHKPVAIHAHFGRGGALALPLARQLGLPLYVTFHGGDATKRTHQRRRLIPSIYQRRLLALQDYASGFLCVSDFVAGRLRDQGFPADKLHTHYIGLDLSTLQEATMRDVNAPYLMVGRLVAKKGFDLVIHALRQLAADGIAPQVEIAGTGPDEAALRAEAAGLDNVQFLGWQTPDQLAAKMAQCQAVIVPSREAANGDCEGLPTVVLEAIRAGAPVVASAHAGIPEIIADGKTGILVPENDVPSLVTALRRCAAMSADAMGGLVTAAQGELRTRFDGRAQSARLEQILLNGV